MKVLLNEGWFLFLQFGNDIVSISHNLNQGTGAFVVNTNVIKPSFVKEMPSCTLTKIPFANGVETSPTVG